MSEIQLLLLGLLRKSAAVWKEPFLGGSVDEAQQLRLAWLSDVSCV